MYLALSTTFTVALVVYCTVAAEYNVLYINGMSGVDNTSCYTSTDHPCQTLDYALHFNNQVNLSNKEVILQGDHYLNSTVTLFKVSNLTIRGASSIHSIVFCIPAANAKEEGAGFKLVLVSNVQFRNVKLEGCGTLQFSTTLRSGVNVKFRSAMYVLNSSNILFSHCHFHKSRGGALSLIDTGGEIRIVNFTVSRSAVPEEERLHLFGGTAVYIEYTYCSPANPDCDHTQNVRNRRNRYIIEDCAFEHNRATNNEITEHIHTVQFRILSGNDGNYRGQGGAISITFKGTSQWNSILIMNCTFYNNSALYGGGVQLLFQDYAMGNNVTISGCRFKSNHAVERAGGGLECGFIVYKSYSVSHNKVVVYDTEFVGNSAGWGGGVAFFSSQTKVDPKNTLSFIKCNWTKNSASIGAAVAIFPDSRTTIFDGIVPTLFLQACRFIENRITAKATFLRNAMDQLSQHVVRSGALHVDSCEINMSAYVYFERNFGSAIFANSAGINVMENTLAHFTQNVAINGGALALLGFSVFKVFPNSQIVFENNSATRGGAVYATTPHQTEFIHSHLCFISYSSLVHPDDWNTSVHFIYNEAKYGSSIYADSIIPCAKQIGNVITNVSEALRWKNFFYIPAFNNNTIVTSASIVKFTLPPLVAPGEKININPFSVDDLNHSFLSVYEAHVQKSSEDEVTSSYIADGYLSIHGRPNTYFNITLQTIDTRHVSSTRSGKLVNCPLGFTLEMDECICSASTTHTFVGMPQCNTTSFRAFLQRGYWAGCIGNGTLVTGYCPTEYCGYPNAASGLVSIPRSCIKLNDETVCISHRKGQLCGECEGGYTALYHSISSKCGKCFYGAVGLLIFVAAELIPLTILLTIILTAELKLTSGLMQSFLLFVQTIPFINYISLFTVQSSTHKVFYKIFVFVIGFLNLDFFKLDELSFCLWNGATVLDNLAFRYASSLYVILLLGFVVFVFRYISLKTILLNLVCCQNIQHWIARHMLKASFIHGISTFLILFYAQYTVTSFQILARLQLYGRGEKAVKSTVHLQGNVEYFGPDHLPYAIPAVFIILLFSIPPPLLLISYPLLWKLKAKWSLTKKAAVASGDDTTFWLIRKLLPLIDSFQGVYKDNCRYFSGLLFLWRMILTAVFAFSTKPDEYYLLTELTLLLILSFYALCLPYKEQLCNQVSIILFGNMAMINALNWYIYSISPDSRASKSAQAASSVMLILTYLPIVYVTAVLTLKRLHRFKWVHKLGLSSQGTPHWKPENKNIKKSLNVDLDEDLFDRAAELNNLSCIKTTTIGLSDLTFQTETRNTSSSIDQNSSKNLMSDYIN